jgi:predicted deacylase
MGSAVKIGEIEAAPGTKKSGFLPVADLNGYGLQMPLMIVNGAKDGPTLLMTAGTHACEYVPVETVSRLCAGLNPKEISGIVLLVPVINVPEFQARSAFISPVDGANQSGALPGDPNGSITHRIGHVLWTQVVSKASCIIEFHGGDLTEENVDFVIVRDTGNEKVDKVQLDVARAFNTEYLWHQAAIPSGDLKASSGGLIGTAARNGIPGVVPEAGHSGRAQESSVQLMYNGALNVMKYLKMLEGEPKWIDQKYFKAQHFVRTSHAGLYVPTGKIGDIVQKDDVVGVVKDVFGETLEELKSPVYGVLDFHEYSPSVLPGNTTWIIGEL